MKNKEYLWAAVDFVIDYAGEQGIKYRRGDFYLQKNKYDWSTGNNLNTCGYLGGENPKGVLVCLRFNFVRCNSLLKSLKNKFLNYNNARVKKDGVYFSFTFRELDILLLKENGDQSEEKLEKIIRQINKLLELGDLEKNPSENEAIAASMKAQELLAKYNLDIAVIKGEKKNEEIGQVIADMPTGHKWKYYLANAVAHSYRCRSYSIGAESIVFYGYRSDSLIARRVFIYLYNVGNRLANSHVKNVKENIGYTTGIYNSFCAGFVVGIDTELSRNCTALTLYVPDEVSKGFNELSKNFANRPANYRINDLNAYQKGVTEGKRALNAQYIEN